MAGDGQPGLPRRRDPDLASLATFALDSQGRVISWSVTAPRLFGHLAAAVTGRDVCDVLMTGPGQRQLVRHALAEVAAGGLWTATVAGGGPGGGGGAPPRGAPGGGGGRCGRGLGRAAPGAGGVPPSAGSRWPGRTAARW